MKSEIIIAKNSGLCFGVRLALRIAKNKAKITKKPVYTLGPIIHNPQAVEILKTKNVYPIEKIDKNILEINKNNSFIIRSHGIEKGIFEKLSKDGFDIIDATCPFVKKAQNIAKDLYSKNIATLIIGDKNHPEVIGIKSYSDNDVLIVNNLSELQNMPLPNKLGIVCQTTQPVSKLNEIVDYLNKNNIETEVHNTICSATIDRQKEAIEIAKNTDLVFVIGGKNSSNTRKLFDICFAVNKNTYHIEEDVEINKDLLAKSKKIGILTGASTPSWIIRKIITKIRRLQENV
jgi:4-hydroxy-3-methylbut-2-enyl diphosphate reductase